MWRSEMGTYERYKLLAGPTVTAYGGRYLVRGGTTEALEGRPSAEQARAGWTSPEYGAAKAIRQGCADTEMLLVEGLL